MSLQSKAKEQKNATMLTKDREHITIDELIAEYPDGVTLRYVDVALDQTRGGKYAICVCDEAPHNFFFGGKVVAENIESLIAVCGGKEQFNAELKDEGLFVKFYKARSKSGYVYTAMTIV